ncbi:hypothetical protein CK216_07715 [Mesorhizobium sp. WSM3876]|nr:hypothetical protein CK216_07715 [Mesorhizobium sp. WSM3876]
MDLSFDFVGRQFAKATKQVGDVDFKFLVLTRAHCRYAQSSQIDRIRDSLLDTAIAPQPRDNLKPKRRSILES